MFHGRRKGETYQLKPLQSPGPNPSSCHSRRPAMKQQFFSIHPNRGEQVWSLTVDPGEVSVCNGRWESLEWQLTRNGDLGSCGTERGPVFVLGHGARSRLAGHGLSEVNVGLVA
ncbi:hypothetical protein AG1IA_10185 [Rhizoctonia solani AG-1 IA]|uniref:Uncharacterized protein n=1 Tax=Thanatephorus cucumeris (strain AG1-IA) TaxID=983506 RepID=L8WCX5_THACA|nr:hypothetical protein AG1IA_10185 [Rhizoctonia solani AG-1 IA]